LAVRLEWEGKPKQVLRLALPFQTVETINESRATRERDSGLFANEADTTGTRNQLIWGDNKLVMSSLLAEYAGEVKLVYIDPPFDTGADFSHRVTVGDTSVDKFPSVLEEHAYRDTWGRGRESYLSMVYERLVLIHELLAADGSLFCIVRQTSATTSSSSATRSSAQPTSVARSSGSGPRRTAIRSRGARSTAVSTM
jgi:adenine-specific DNA-methyltransferase